MKTFINWLVWSSKDPRQVAMTVRGALLFMVPVAMYALGITQEEANSTVELVAQLIQQLFVAVSTVLTLVGFGRKLYITIQNILNKKK